MSPNILGNVSKHSGECRQTFRGMSPNIQGNVRKHSGECSQTIQGIFENNLRHVVKHPVESMKAFGWMYILDTGDHELCLFVEEPSLLNSRKRKRASLRFLKELRNFKRKLFLCPPQNRRNTTNILKLLYFTVNVHCVTSNQISTYRKLNLHLTSSIYFIFLPLEMQKWLEQAKIYHAFSYFVWKGTTHKPLQLPAAKTLISNVYVIGTTCFDECFPFYVITGRQCFFYESLSLPWDLFKRHVAAFLKPVFWKKSVFYAISPQ